jgi:hypothetical protein
MCIHTHTHIHTHTQTDRHRHRHRHRHTNANLDSVSSGRHEERLERVGLFGFGGRAAKEVVTQHGTELVHKHLVLCMYHTFYIDVSDVYLSIYLSIYIYIYLYIFFF